MGTMWTGQVREQLPGQLAGRPVEGQDEQLAAEAPYARQLLPAGLV